jgi:hypothetical protein
MLLIFVSAYSMSQLVVEEYKIEHCFASSFAGKNSKIQSSVTRSERRNILAGGCFDFMFIFSSFVLDLLPPLLNVMAFN